MNFLFRILSKILIKYLSQPSSNRSNPTHSFEFLSKTIEPGDVLLVEGQQRFSTAIKYLTQSNWSHAAIYVGKGEIIEAELEEGVIASPLSKYASYHTRICRPVSLVDEDQLKLVEYSKNTVGHQYDLKNVFDLARYLLPTPPVPTSMRRKLLKFGSGDPTRAICSSMIATAFQVINYPILPVMRGDGEATQLKKRHPSLFTPSDFDRSPYFKIVKPTIEQGFSYKKFSWSSE